MSDNPTEPYGREHWQHLNQDYSRAGLPPVMPEEWAAINAMAEQMDAVMVGSPGELDGNPLAQATAAEVIAQGVRPDDKFWQDLKLPLPAINTDTRWCPDYDEAGTATPRVRAFVHDRQADAHVWVPLTDRQQWTEVADAYLFPNTRCQAHNHPDCEYFQQHPSTDVPLTAYKVDRGEHVVILFVCPTCRTRMDNLSWTDQDYIQRGALPWYDDGTQASDGWSD